MHLAPGAPLALLLLVLTGGCRAPALEADPSREVASAAEGPVEALIHARVTTVDGTVLEGPLRFGGSEEALWSHQFNGFRTRNPWMEHAPRDQLPRERLSTEILGVTISAPGAQYSLGRPFMARLGDITRIEAGHRTIHVTLKSGTTFDLNRYSADDLADGIRIWDVTQGMVDLSEGKLRSIEFQPAPRHRAEAGAAVLHGTVQTAEGRFTGLIQWDREEALGSDLFEGQGADGPVRLRYDAIGSIERVGSDRSLVTLRDGRALELAGTRNAGQGNRGLYVDDARYGRVLIDWTAFERVDFSPAGSGAPPGYHDFAPGQPLMGTVVTWSGRRLTGRLVYDLDESETTETLDAPAAGVDYQIPFRLIASIEPAPGLASGAGGAAVTLRSGESLALEGFGDLGWQHAGMLVFVPGQRKAEYVPWADVARVELEVPSASNVTAGAGW